MILDHIENLAFDPGDQDYLYEAQMTLGRLSRGLFWLNDAVTAAELQSRIAAQRENVVVGALRVSSRISPYNGYPARFSGTGCQSTTTFASLAGLPPVTRTKPSTMSTG